MHNSLCNMHAMTRWITRMFFSTYLSPRNFTDITLWQLLSSSSNLTLLVARVIMLEEAGCEWMEITQRMRLWFPDAWASFHWTTTRVFVEPASAQIKLFVALFTLAADISTCNHLNREIFTTVSLALVMGKLVLYSVLNQCSQVVHLKDLFTKSFSTSPQLGL